MWIEYLKKTMLFEYFGPITNSADRKPIRMKQKP